MRPLSSKFPGTHEVNHNTADFGQLFFSNLRHNSLKQGLVSGKQLARAHKAHSLQRTRREIRWREFNGIGIGIGAAGDLQAHPVVSAGCRQHQGRS